MAKIIAVGQHTFPAVPANSGQHTTITIPAQTDTNYQVFTSFNTNSSGYAFLVPTVYSKTTTSFILEVWNSWSTASGGSARVGYLVIKNS